MSLGIPAGAFGTALLLEDREGSYEFIKSYSTNMLITFGLKYSITAQRPDKSANDSFPSGHTSSSFAGASFIHKRYGFKYAIIPYLGAIYTGYSRVKSDKHYNRDVFAGALIGVASSWYFTTSYKNLDIKPVVGVNYKGISVAYRW